MSARQKNQAEAHLVDHCLAGDQEAWRTLFSRHHAGLLGAVTRLLGAGRRNEELAEEIAARVWCSLVELSGRRLRAYDPRRGRLSTFLASLAKQELLLHYRSTAAQREHEKALGSESPSRSGDLYYQSGVLVSEFQRTLSLRERVFFREHLLRASGGQPPLPSPANWRKLKQRVLGKLLAFLSRH